MNVHDEKMTRLLERLLAKTQLGELRWREGVRWNSFQVDFPEHSVVVYKNDITDVKSEALRFSMKVVDSHGNEAASLPATDDMGQAILSAENVPSIARLYEEAGRSIAPSERVIDALLAELR